MLRKSKRLDFDAAIVQAERPAQVVNLSFAELCAAYVAVAYDDADFRLRKWAGGLGARSAWAITRDMLQHCAEAMLAAGYKPSTVNRDVAQIGTIFKWARKKRMTPPGFRSPTANFEWFDEPERIVHANEKEIAKLREDLASAREESSNARAAAAASAAALDTAKGELRQHHRGAAQGALQAAPA